MKLTLSTPKTGVAYFPGLAAPRTLDVDSLPAQLAKEIEACVARIEAEAEAPAEPSGFKDDLLHSLIVERSDGQVQRYDGPPVGAMGELVTAFRAGLRAVGKSKD